ncbi:MAG: hypothetical protein J5492_04960, partial [Oxalobacter sp.]|nr:hypothetical protein [Oxalobacter sp.]
MKKCLGAALVSMAIVSVGAQAEEATQKSGFAPDSVSFEVGAGEHVQLARVGFQWDWNKDWFRTE